MNHAGQLGSQVCLVGELTIEGGHVDDASGPCLGIIQSPDCRSELFLGAAVMILLYTYLYDIRAGWRRVTSLLHPCDAGFHYGGLSHAHSSNSQHQGDRSYDCNGGVDPTALSGRCGGSETCNHRCAGSACGDGLRSRRGHADDLSGENSPRLDFRTAIDRRTDLSA